MMSISANRSYQRQDSAEILAMFCIIEPPIEEYALVHSFGNASDFSWFPRWTLYPSEIFERPVRQSAKCTLTMNPLLFPNAFSLSSSDG
jgi:hypothetical protein